MKIGFTCSCFDLLHAGHILMLKDAKEQCDKLIVGLQTDPTLDRPEKNKPIQTLEERKIQLEAVKYVDEIRIYSTEAELRDMLCEIWPDVRILGSDYITKDNFKIVSKTKPTKTNSKPHTIHPPQRDTTFWVPMVLPHTQCVHMHSVTYIYMLHTLYYTQIPSWYYQGYFTITWYQNQGYFPSLGININGI